MRRTARSRPCFAVVIALLASSACSVTLGLDDLDRDGPGASAGAGGIAAAGAGGGGSGGARAGAAGTAGKAGEGGRAGQSGQGGQSGGGQGGQSGGGQGGTAGGGGTGAGGGGTAGSGASGGGAGGSSGSAGAGGAAGGNAGAAGAGAGGTMAGASGAAGAGQAGTSGGAGAPTCGLAQLGKVLHEVSVPTNQLRDLHTNGSLLVFVSTEAKDAFFSRPANIAPGDPTRVTVQDADVVAARLRANDVVVLSPDHAAVAGFDGQKQCTGSPPGGTNARFGTCPTQRLWAVDGKQIATAGCGRQIVAPIDATGTPIGGGPCDNNAWSDVAADGAVGGADETLGLALRDNRVYSVDRVGATYQIVEKTWPQTTEVKPAYEKATVIATIPDGTPRGAIVAGLFVYTSVRNGSQWDIRRYTLGKVDERVLLHTGIQDLALFTVVDDRVIFAVGTGSKGTQIFRGLPGGEGAGPPQLVGCGPVAPAQIAATNAFVFWTDLTPPMNGKPSLRGVAVDP